MTDTIWVLITGGITSTITIALAIVNATIQARYRKELFDMYLLVFTRLTAVETQMAILLPQHLPQHKTEPPAKQ